MIFYLKISKSSESDKSFKINHSLVSKYFVNLKDTKSTQFVNFETYFESFFHFCFEIALDSMVEELENFKY